MSFGNGRDGFCDCEALVCEILAAAISSFLAIDFFSSSFFGADLKLGKDLKI